MGIYFKCEIKTDTGDIGHVDLKLDGTNLGSKFIIGGIMTEGDGASESIISSSDNPLFTKNSPNYVENSISSFIPLKVLDDTTTITVRLHKAVGSNDFFIKNIEIEVVYIPFFIDD